MKEVVFYYDVVCPFAYMASRLIEGVASRNGAKILWKPVLLGKCQMSPIGIYLALFKMYAKSLYKLKFFFSMNSFCVKSSEKRAGIFILQYEII